MWDQCGIEFQDIFQRGKMAMTRHPTKTTGVRYKLHSSRRHGVNFDKYFSIRYRVDGKLKEEGLGWSSEGWSEKKAAAVLAELKSNITTSTGPRTLAEKRDIEGARRNELELHERLKQQQAERAQDLLFNNVFTRYCESNSHKKSLKDEINYSKNWIAPALGTKRLDEIILLDLERIKKRMTSAGNAARSVQYVKSIIRQVYHFAIDHKIYSGEVPTANFLKKQKIDNRRQRYLSHEEATLLLEEIRQHSATTYRISLLSLNSGMRFGEIAGLLWQHIDTDRKEILVVDAKNGQSRSVYMTAAVVQMFSGMKRGAANELVFPATNGKRMERASKVFAAAVNHTGLNEGITDRRMKFVFHSLRHSCASWLVNSGVELPVIAKILGHKTLAMTMRYSHVNDRSVRNAMTLLDDQQQPGGKIVSIGSKR